MLDTSDTWRKCAVNMLRDLKVFRSPASSLRPPLEQEWQIKRDHHLIRLMTGKRNVDAVRVGLLLSQASAPMLVRPYCVNTTARETTAGEKHTAQTWRLMTKWLRQLFSISGVRRCKMHLKEWIWAASLQRTLISGFRMLSNFPEISSLAFKSFPETITALPRSALPFTLCLLGRRLPPTLHFSH